MVTIDTRRDTKGGNISIRYPDHSEKKHHTKFESSSSCLNRKFWTCNGMPLMRLLAR